MYISSPCRSYNCTSMAMFEQLMQYVYSLGIIISIVIITIIFIGLVTYIMRKIGAPIKVPVELTNFVYAPQFIKPANNPVKSAPSLVDVPGNAYRSHREFIPRYVDGGTDPNPTGTDPAILIENPTAEDDLVFSIL